MKIQAAVAHSAEAPFSIEECELQEPGVSELLVELRACGICATDLSVKSGKLPIELPALLGHEGAGVIKKIGDGFNTMV